MKDIKVDNFLRSLHLGGLHDSEKTIKIAQALSEMPWGEARTIDTVFEKGVGTCTGKHKVLQACFDELGIKYKPVVCTFKWGEQELQFPDELQEILNEGEWEHGHNFVKLENGNYLDVTWDAALKPFGFKTLPLDWTPERSFIGVQSIKQQWEGASIDQMKSQIIGSLAPEIRERRERFLHGLVEWIDGIHQKVIT